MVCDIMLYRFVLIVSIIAMFFVSCCCMDNGIMINTIWFFIDVVELYVIIN